MIKFLKASGIFASLILYQGAYATVFTLDESGNYIVSDSIGPNFIAPSGTNEEALQIEIVSTDSEVQSDLISKTNFTNLSYDVIITDPNVLKANESIKNKSSYENYDVIITDPEVLRQVSLTSDNNVSNSDTRFVFSQETKDTLQDSELNIVVDKMATLEQQPITNNIPNSPVKTILEQTFDDAVKAELTKYTNIDMAFVKAVIKAESNFNPTAVSPKGAMGLMQIMPKTAETYGVVNPFSPEENIRAGMAELSRLMDVFNNPTLALAGYNAGQAAVEKYDGVPPFRETQEYIVKVLTYTFQAREEARQSIPNNSNDIEMEAENKNRKLLPMTVKTFDW